MKAQETSFKQLIQGEKQFQVPLYQRTYGWQREQLNRIWDDIRQQATALSDGQAITTHLLGSVVLAPSPSLQAAGVQRWLVVDGQQRLTTLMLAMCAIRDHLAIHDATQRERFNELYLTNKWQHGDAFFRVMPTRADRGSFFACINSTADAGGPDNVGAAYRFFREQLTTNAENGESIDVTNFERVISEQLALVEITVTTDDNVYRIFESLNNTGLKLSQADLVRNLVLMLLPTRAELVYETLWLPMQTRLGPEQLDDLFYFDLVLSGQERVRRDGTYQAFTRRLDVHHGDESAIEEVVRGIGRRSKHLQRIVEPSTEPDSTLRSAFQRLNAWGAQVAYPVIMHLLDLHERQQATLKAVVSAVGYIESFLVRRMICAVPTNNLNRIFNSLASQLRSDSAAEGIREVLSRERNFWPDDPALRAAILAKPFYWQGRAQQRQVVLRRLEESYPSQERIDFERAPLTIEHVMPQSPSTEWLGTLQEEVDPGETAEDLHRRFVHTLGNLTLTAYNAQLSNNPFQRKLDLLERSNLEMNRRITATPRWVRTRSWPAAMISQSALSRSGQDRFPEASCPRVETGAYSVRRWRSCQRGPGQHTGMWPR